MAMDGGFVCHREKNRQRHNASIVGTKKGLF
jgi:hypothetical protein